MRIFWLPLVIVIAISIILDVIIIRKGSKSGKKPLKYLAIAYVVASAATLVGMIAMFTKQPADTTATLAHFHTTTRVMLAYFILSVPKWLWGLFYGLGAALRKVNYDASFILKAAGVAFAALAAITMLQGTFFTPYKVNVAEQPIEFATLPQSFDGYRIVHISDAHLGTYGNDTAFISEVVDAINKLNPDAICFTGDLVSLSAQEAVPFQNVLARLKARDGIFTVMGNHDYAHYMRSFTPVQQLEDERQLRIIENKMGWQLLNNRNVVLHRAGDSITIVGTENNGEPPFQGTGDYAAAARGLDGMFKVHMQHNPALWRASKTEDAQLTLSGHTHAMQMVFQLAGIKWSPASLKYNEWGGLYQDGSRQLYVNTGLGMVGPPMRIGVQPEVTVITLKKR